jgi:hypothetical protein
MTDYKNEYQDERIDFYTHRAQYLQTHVCDRHNDPEREVTMNECTLCLVDEFMGIHDASDDSDEQSFANGRKAARRKYAESWVDATGETIYEHEFTAGFIKERVAALFVAARKLVEVTGEVDEEFGFIPCPIASLTGNERDKLSPWIKEEWAALHALVNPDVKS